MEQQKRTPNRLANETSPYLLEHAYNPVDWYPWGEEAFEKAKAEDKPVFLSVGYSACHWCHVMARESFEDAETAGILNASFVCVKVDREERPDVDCVYMAVCQAFTGGGGWPMSIFLTPEKKPFFAGTYFPPASRPGMPGFIDLLTAISEKWKTDRAALTASADGLLTHLNRPMHIAGTPDEALINGAIALYRQSFDAEYGGFGSAPKFPAPHNLLFLLTHYEKSGDRHALGMAEKTLNQMYRGGLFDHVGKGFCRYSTDRFFLVPHFEKMLYDNALLIMAYTKAYVVTKKPLYLQVAEWTAEYALREMTGADGGFFSAQDADSEGVEGKYYTFTPDEITGVLGEERGRAFNRCFGITARGNFEGKSIPNLLPDREADPAVLSDLPALYAYRKERSGLRLDDKVLTGWNALMIAALCRLYRAGRQETYLCAAQKAYSFIENRLCDGETLFVSFRAGRRGEPGFLDDYASYIFALLSLYEATLDEKYRMRALALTKKTVAEFCDDADGGFFLYGNAGESLIFRPKETYDGAVPSGNSMMAANLVRLSQMTDDPAFTRLAEQQLSFLSGAAERYPMGYSMFLTALWDWLRPLPRITVVLKEGARLRDAHAQVEGDAIVTALHGPTKEYPLKNGETTFYVCRDHTCYPPVNDLAGVEETSRPADAEKIGTDQTDTRS